MRLRVKETAVACDPRAVGKFQSECESNLAAAVSKHWRLLFPGLPQPQVSLILIANKISYEYSWKEAKACGRPMTDRFRQRYIAAQSLQLSGLSPTMQSILKFEITQERQMKANTQKKVERMQATGSIHKFQKCAGRTLKLGVADTWAYLFRKNETLPRAQKLTDKQITEFLNREFPGRQSAIFTKVAQVRSRYNGGRLTGDIPKQRSVAYDPDGIKHVAKVKQRSAKAMKAAGGPLNPPAKLVLKRNAAPAA